MTRAVGIACILLALSVPRAARGDETATTEGAAALPSAVKALREGRPADAIALLEAFGDRGLVDPVASFDRGLAYASRVRIGAEVPGDLGRAAQAFEEARDLSRDPRLREEASHALAVVRGELARRRMRAGQPVEVDQGRSLGRSLAQLLSENAWSWVTVAASLALSLGLFARWLGRGTRVRVAGGVTAGLAACAAAIAAAMTVSVRHDRHTLREAVVVTASGRPTDARGLALPGATPLPEGARVELIDSLDALAKVRFGSADIWVARSAVRELARWE